MLKILETNKKKIEVANLVFLCIFCIYAILREVVPIEIYIGSSLLSYAAFAGCLFFSALNFLSCREYFKTPNSIIFAAFTGILCVSIIVNKDFAFASNIKALLWILVFFFYIYPLGRNMLFNNKKYVKVLFSTVVITFTALMLLSLTTYYFDVDYTFYKTTGTLTNQGFSNDYIRLWGVFQEANYGAIYTSAALIMAMYLFVKTKKLVLRVLLAIASVLFLLFIILSGSRTAQLITSIAVGWIAFYTVFTKYEAKAIKKALFSILSCLLSVLLYLCLFAGIKFVLPYTKAAVANMVSPSTYAAVHKAYDNFYRNGKVNVIEGFYDDATTLPEDTTDPDNTTDPEQNGPGAEINKLERPDIANKTDITNGRLRRWIDAFKIFKAAPILGTSPRGISEFAQAHAPDTTMAKYYFSISNIYLEILVETGIIGFAVLLIIIAKTLLLFFKKTYKGPFSFGFLTHSTIVLILACSAFLQSDLFFTLSFGGTVFWLAMGYINNKSPQNV